MKKKYYLIISLIVLSIFVLGTSTVNAQSKNSTEPQILHSPILVANPGYDLLISCDIIYQGDFTATLMIRKPGVWQYDGINMTYGFNNMYYAVIPSSNITTAGLEYYLYVYVNENISATYPNSNASDNPFRITVRLYSMEVSPTLIYTGIAAVVLFSSLYAVDIIEIKNPWGGKKK